VISKLQDVDGEEKNVYSFTAEALAIGEALTVEYAGGRLYEGQHFGY